MRAGDWMRANLATQGYCLSAADSSARRIGLRFSTGFCLSLVVVALVTHSTAMVLALSGIGLVASIGPRHPFDYLWNHAVRRIAGEPPLPRNPTRRRQAFMVATGWLAIVCTLLAAGATTIALALGWLLVAACTLVTATNLCLPSAFFAWWERRTDGKELATP